MGVEMIGIKTDVLSSNLQSQTCSTLTRWTLQSRDFFSSYFLELVAKRQYLFNWWIRYGYQKDRNQMGQEDLVVGEAKADNRTARNSFLEDLKQRIWSE